MVFHTVFPFTYGNYNEFIKILKHNNIGIVKMEVSRNQGPENNFLHKVRKLCTKHNIILIFDECTSGFRQTYGGLHKFYKVEPDILQIINKKGTG